jgi:N-acetylneuraminic acid mutarotase
MKTPILAFLCALSTAFLASGQVPSLINYQGRLTDANGAPVTGNKNFSINIFDAATGGNLLYSETIGAVTLDSNGVYSFQFGSAGTSNKQVTETIGTTAGTTLVYSKALANSSVVNNSITVTDGTNSWSQSVGNPGAGATATANTIVGFVIGATITNGGSGYTTAPTVTISGNGTGATATATLTDGVVTGINVTSAGSGYTTGATITIAPPVIPFRVEYSSGTITATYASAPTAGRTIAATYRYGTGGIADALGNASEQWMAITVDGVTQGARQRVLAVPFAQRAGVASNALMATEVQDGSITSQKLAPGSASANLQTEGLSGIAGGGVVMSIGQNDRLATAGYVRFGDTQLSQVWKKRTQAPSKRANHSTVWTGTEMIVWGGVNAPNGNSIINTGAIYNPSTESWRTASLTNAPSARSFHTAIWTGTEMIVWGGYNGNGGTRSDGARYNPTTDTWNSISSSGAPAGMDRHTAVWTGTEMIVWGYSGGGAYNPTTNSWRNVSTTNVPAARRDHRSVWTGSKMIIWGGFSTDSSSSALNTGGCYDPTTNTWNTITTSGAPSPRAFHSAVWTGSEMLVWGGVTAPTGGSFFSDGAKYNPISNTWTSIASDTLIPRAWHSAVWTGSNMIIWGGGDSINRYPNGRIYDPVINTWSTILGLGTPIARTDHSAVWTGGEMIVYGGFDSSYNALDNTDTYMPPTTMYYYRKP